MWAIKHAGSNVAVAALWQNAKKKKTEFDVSLTVHHSVNLFLSPT
jgi:hypothetical protein